MTEKRGYCGIGIERPKFVVNLGTLWRSAHCLGADFIFTVGDLIHPTDRYCAGNLTRDECYRPGPSDTTLAYKHIPFFAYGSVDDLYDHLPLGCQVVGVEITDYARALETFCHPERAIYLLGPENGSLSKAAQAMCNHIVKIESSYCLNVASAGTVVLYDRQTKAMH